MAHNKKQDKAELIAKETMRIENEEKSLIRQSRPDEEDISLTKETAL